MRGACCKALALRISPTPNPTHNPAQAVAAIPTAPDTGRAAPVQADPVIAGLIGFAALGGILFLSCYMKINRGD